MPSGGIFDFDVKSERLVEVLRELENPKIWDNPEQAQALGKERGHLEVIVNTINELERGLTDAEESSSSIIFNRLEQALSLCPSSLNSKTQQSNSKPTENKNKNNKKSKKN